MNGDLTLSIVAEHIKQRLWETALNEPDHEASKVIADMAGRIDFWIGELKEGVNNDSISMCIQNR